MFSGTPTSAAIDWTKKYGVQFPHKTKNMATTKRQYLESLKNDRSINGPGSRGGRRFLMNRFPMMSSGILINATMRRAQAKEMLGFPSKFPIAIGPSISPESKLVYKDIHPLTRPRNIFPMQVLASEKSNLECKPA